MRAYADRSDAFDRSGRRLVTDPPIRRLVEQRLAETPPSLPDVEDPFDPGDRDLVALRGRISSGFAVQLLLDRSTGETFLTCVLAGVCETFPVPPECANDAFEHPFLYGCTLPL